MNCQRCDGLMVREAFGDLWDCQPCCDAMRCLLCGDIVDQVILLNRNQRAGLAVAASKRRAFQNPLALRL